MLISLDAKDVRQAIEQYVANLLLVSTNKAIKLDRVWTTHRNTGATARVIVKLNEQSK